ncbi:internal (core) protein [Enterobacter phage 03_vB_Eclo_IJM]|nr:internal (core) protein [Enterobacter phage 03_vB_Eclo_IJM]
MTPQRQMLITAEANLLEAVKRKSVEQAKANTKLIQQQNKQLVIDDVYNRRLAGENVLPTMRTFRSTSRQVSLSVRI